MSAGAAERPPLPPFSFETAAQKVRAAEDGWNTRDPARVALAYTEESRWRNRSEFLSGPPLAASSFAAPTARPGASDAPYQAVRPRGGLDGPHFAAREHR